MKTVALHYSFEFLAGMRNRTLLLMNYLMPLGFYALVGTMMAQINPFFGDQMIPAMVAFAILSGTIMGLPTPLIESREGGILRSFRVHGFSAAPLLAMPAITTAVHTGLVAAVITLTAPMLFDAPAPTDPWTFVLITALLAFALSGLGSLIGVVSAGSKVAILWQQLIYLPSMILGGLMIPVEILPDAFARVAHLLPATYGMQAFLGGAFGMESLYSPAAAAGVLFAGGIAAFGLALYLFSWDDKNGGRRGHPALAALALLPYAIGAIFLVS